jgi:hypothetical protein
VLTCDSEPDGDSMRSVDRHHRGGETDDFVLMSSYPSAAFL